MSGTEDERPAGAVRVRGELRLSAGSLAAVLRELDGPTDLRHAADDPRVALGAHLASAGRTAEFDGVRVSFGDLPHADRSWTSAADRLFAVLVHFAEGGSLTFVRDDGADDGDGDAAVEAIAGRPLVPIFVDAGHRSDSAPASGPESGSAAKRLAGIPAWVPLASAERDRQFTLIAPRSAAVVPPDSLAEIDIAAPGTVAAYAGAIDGRELFVGIRPLSAGDAASDSVRSLLLRTINGDVAGAADLIAAVESAVVHAGLILADAPDHDDPRLLWLARVAYESGGVVMDDSGTIVRFH